MSLWYDSKKKTYGSKGKSWWIKNYVDKKTQTTDQTIDQNKEDITRLWTEVGNLISHITDMQALIMQNNIKTGRKLEGTGVTIDGQKVTAQSGAEICNNYNANRAVGRYSTAMGSGTVAKGDNSVAMGLNSRADGYCAVAMGYESEADGDHQLVCGRYNIADDSKTFVIGNGTDASNRSNAFTIDKDGNGAFMGRVETDGIILRSNSKRFCLTIDDNGTITVAEI